MDELNRVVKKLSKQEIDSLPIFEFKSSSSNNENDAGDSVTCSICFEDYVKKDMIMALACSHKFHSKCIKQWLQQNRRCPLCQKDGVTGK